MNSLINKPYKQIWSTLFVILFFSILGYNRTVDIQQHDTYFVFSLGHLGMVLSILLFLIGGIYWLTKKEDLVSWMTKGHVRLTIFLASALIFFGFSFKFISEYDHRFFQNFSTIFILTLFLFMLVQILLIINLMISFLKK